MKPAAGGERLQKVLARAGLGSRRDVDAWIAAGRVRVDGVVAAPGLRVRGHERVEVDGRALRLPQPGPRPPRLLLYHKPEGEVCTRRDPQERPTVFERLPPLRGARWIGVGRLDVNTSGLLLLTDDGALAQRLMHPAGGYEREYAVRVRGPVPEAALAALRAGVTLDDGPARCLRLEAAGGEGQNQWFRMVVGQGRNRLVRRLWDSQGLAVSRLIRVRFGPVELPRDLHRGQFRAADAAVRRALGLPALAPPRAARLERPPRRR